MKDKHTESASQTASICADAKKKAGQDATAVEGVLAKETLEGAIAQEGTTQSLTVTPNESIQEVMSVPDAGKKTSEALLHGETAQHQ